VEPHDHHSGALGLVAAVALVIGALIVVLVSLAVVGLSAREPDPTGEQTDPWHSPFARFLAPLVELQLG
jgi:hypothetical protein